jgi:hypothetical protein
MGDAIEIANRTVHGSVKPNRTGIKVRCISYVLLNQNELHLEETEANCSFPNRIDFVNRTALNCYNQLVTRTIEKTENRTESNIRFV